MTSGRRSTRPAAEQPAGFSGARDAEVKIATLNSVTGSNPPPDGAGDWLGELEEEAEGPPRRAQPGSLAEVRDAIDGVKSAAFAWPGSAAGRDGCRERRSCYRRGRKAMKRANERRGGRLHDWRNGRRTWYQLEILGPRLPEGFDRLRTEATDRADRLGDLHDLDVLAGDLESGTWNRKTSLRWPN